MADKIWATIEEPIRRQIEKRQRLMLQNSNYKQRVTYLNKKCDIRVTPLSYDITNPGDYVNFFFNNDYIKNTFTNTENTFTNSSYKSKIERPFIENFELISRTGDNSKVGVLRTGKMSIKIFTKDQFNKIEKYFRIGSALLIEWGWSNYVSNGTNNEIGNTGYFKNHLYNDFKNSSLKEEHILEHIKTHTLSSDGNYDGAIMFINNFSVNFENGINDFYYTLNVDFIGKSLLINELFGNKFKANEEDKITNNSDSRIFSNPLINLLRFIETIPNKNNIPEFTQRVIETIGAEGETSRNVTEINRDTILKENNTDLPKLASNLFTPPNTKATKEIIERYDKGILYSRQSTDIYSYNFISLEYFLELLSNLIDIKYEHLDQRYILSEYNYKTGRVLSNITTRETKEIEYNFKINSFDTRVCVLSHQLKNDQVYGNQNDLPKTLFDSNESNNIKDIYLRVTYLKDLLINLLRSNEDFTLNNILSKILDDINRVTANELKLEYTSNDGNGTYTIISNSSSEVKSSDKNNLLSLKIYNKSAVGSLVEEVNIDTTIDSKVANTIAIASLGQPLNEIPNESFGLLKFNKNIKSRLNIENISSNLDKSKIQVQDRLEKNFKFLTENIFELLNLNNGSINFDKNDTFIELINAFKQIRTDLINLSIIDENVNTLPRNTPLIPVLYNFSMPGISGLYPTNLLKIDDQRLPDIYQTSNSYYIITGITHTINNREWKTSVKTNFQLS